MLPALVFPTPGTSEPATSGLTNVEPAKTEATPPPKPAATTPVAEPSKTEVPAPDPAVKVEPVNSERVNRASGQPDPARFEPPEPELTTPERANH
jgi:hypothetical protein